MKKTLLPILALFIQCTAFSQSTQQPDFRKIYSFALQANITKALAWLDSLPADLLTEEQKQTKERYYRRFRTQEDQPTYPTTDPVLLNLLQHYQAYWHKALTDQQQVAQYEKQLKENIGQFLTEQHYVSDGKVQGDVVNNFTQHLKYFLSQKGYYSATGKTAGLFDLYIWPKEVKMVYQVKLPKGQAATTVIFIENTITMGWEEYATFGRNYPGGWSTSEVLYCVRKAYDTTSESFKVSYLKHEGQHFASQNLFPKLTGADLEYRAKLTELYFADQTLYNTINTFIRNASKEGRSAHPFGNYCVIRDLSQKLFQQEFVSDIDQWKKIDVRRIHTASKQLLKAHTKALKKAGAKTVTEYIQ